MFKAIAGTAFTRVAVMIAGFLTVLINARYLGSDGLGTVGLIVLAITINAMLGGLAGGGAIVYLAPRFKFFHLAAPAYIWSFISSVLGTYIMDYLSLLPAGFRSHILLLSLLSSVNQLHLNALLGFEKIKMFNVLSLIQAALLAVLLFFFAAASPQPLSFVKAMYISQIFILLSCVIILRSKLEFQDLSGLQDSIPAMVKLGFFVQIANVVQLFNYRMIYYIIDMQLGRAMLGVFDLGTKVSEGVWMTAKSVATVQYSHIANSKNQNYAAELTLKLFKFTTIISLLALITILLIPEEVYLWMFGNSFLGIKAIIWYLSPGILAVSVGMIISHFFAGCGLHRINTLGSVIGLAVLSLLGFILVPSLSLKGAAIAVSLCHFASFLFGFIVFKHKNAFRLVSFLPSFKDLDGFKDSFKHFLQRM